ncbi:Tetratricopeptide repeat-containing protein [Carnobacterium iners]|uniref:Tetratricopeptide repeat-containing protein n=1 Tax=Carnobacterium iners TaxID=1073423 RepID=A0A1X7NNS6_9LACT|nr:tetratricopeptide repeat protein [Carnobacterium iners]SEK69298.1 Tetratricopeptide repeat-containing protein [Carnobacterium iners]SMH38887.1 Tetratricopeptide repeat-containing protein [Carnobacterium iners]
MNQNHKAFQLWENGQLNEAIQLLFKEIEKNSENSDAYCNLASLLILAKKYEDAQVVLETALKKYPKQLELLYAFGNLYYHKNNAIKALDYFIKVFNGNEVRLKEDATIMIGQCYLVLNNPKKALVYLLLAHENNKKDNSVILLLGDCMMQISYFNEAKNYYIKSLKLSPDNDEALFKRGLVGAALKEKSENFTSFFEKSKELDPKKYEERLYQLKEIESFIFSQNNNIKKETYDRRDG